MDISLVVADYPVVIASGRRELQEGAVDSKASYFWPWSRDGRLCMIDATIKR